VTLAATVALVRGLTPVRPGRGRWRELLATTLPLGLTLAVNELYFRIDTFILSLFRPFAEVGQYTLAFRVFELLAVFPAIVMTSAFPLLSRHVRRDAATPLRLLLCATGPAWLSGLLGYALIAADRQRSLLGLSAAALVVNVALNLALVPAYGPDAAAAVAVACEALLLAGGWWLVRRHLGLTPRLRLLWRALVAAAAMAALLLWLRDLTLAVLVPAGAAAYAAVLAAVGGLDRRRLEVLRA